MENILDRYLGVRGNEELVFQRGRMLSLVLLVSGAAVLVFTFVTIVFGPRSWVFLAIDVISLIIFGGLYWYTRRGHGWPRYVFLAYLALAMPVAFQNDLDTPLVIALAAPVVMAPLIAAPWLSIPTAAVEAILLYVLTVVLDYPPMNPLVVVILGVFGIISWVSSWSLESALREARHTSKALGESNRQLQAEIAERVHAEAALRESELRFSSVVQSANDAIIIMGGRDTVVAWNDAARAMFGYEEEDILGQSVVTLMPERFRDAYWKGLTRMHATGQAYVVGNSIEMEGLTKGGQEFPGEVSFASWGTGDGQFVSAIVRDITERKQAEAALEAERASLARRVAERTVELSAANADLAQALRARDEFLAAMSHELRTPLNAVLGLAEALQEGIYGPLNQRQLQALRNIGKSGHHLLLLINDVLDVVQIGAGKLTLRMGPIPVESICEASLETVKSGAREKRLQVVSTYDSAVEIVQADRRRLKQILVNLLKNGVKFTPEGGAVGLEVAGDAERGVVHFTVWDTGVGMSEEDLGRLFQPFVQLDSGLARSYGGTGLGLALVHQLADLHGGGVSVESEVGQGSRFTVSLPWRPGQEADVTQMASAQAAEHRPEPAEVVPEPSAVVLVAEDNEVNLSSLRDYLLSRGYQVVVARNGEEAIAQAREKRPDLILMDIQMPVMDGLEATRRIRADADMGRVPIVALTALAMRGDRERCLAAGVDEYLSKPVSFRGLVELIEAQVRLGQKGGVM